MINYGIIRAASGAAQDGERGGRRAGRRPRRSQVPPAFIVQPSVFFTYCLGQFWGQLYLWMAWIRADCFIRSAAQLSAAQTFFHSWASCLSSAAVAA